MVALPAGGHGTCVDFPDNAELQAALGKLFSSGKVVSGRYWQEHKTLG
jgi:hypothetical protein